MRIERSFSIKKGGSERATIIGEILELINKERTKPKSKYKPLTAAFLATKLAHLEKQDLYYLISQAKEYAARTKQPSSKYIFSALKVRENQKRAGMDKGSTE